MEHTKHLWRVAFLVLVVVAGYSLGRHALVPETFGDEGFYRAASRRTLMAQEPVHGSAGACAACHGEQADTVAGGKHATVACESCHAPLSDHARDGEKIADMPVRKSSAHCALCHAPLRARPTGFPQVDFAAHMVDLGAMDEGAEVPDEACVLCHTPHDPAQED